MGLWPLIVHIGAAVAVAALMVGLSWLLGERRAAPSSASEAPYESGVPPTARERSPFSARFYLVAVFFVVFDIEAVFLFAWAVAAPELGWPGFVEAAVFVGVLLAALLYLWRVGALDTGPRREGAP